ncbi:MAG: prepilin-type N-terminal cleavage/methylation domain-containing protein [Lysinibacillus sp.]
MMRDERGFTLIEMLLVLMIFSIITIIAISFSYRYVKVNQYEHAIEQLKLTLHVAQLTAQQEKVAVYVYIGEGNNIFLTTAFKEYELNWEMPEGMNVYFHTNSGTIRFTHNGNISEIGKVEIRTPKKTMMYSINMSKGRLRFIE